MELNPNKDGLFEGRFSGGGRVKEDLIQYQYNFM